jgi:hypothetical protein
MGANMSNVVKNDDSVVILLMKDLPLRFGGNEYHGSWRLIATDLILTNQKARNSHKMFQRSQKLVQVRSILGTLFGSGTGDPVELWSFKF